MKLSKLEKQMLEALKEAAHVIFTQNNGNCLVSVLDAIDKADSKYKKTILKKLKKRAQS
jgi:hypothetical protein